MGSRCEKAGLVLWSLICSTCIFNLEKTKKLFLLWEDIWRKEKMAPWIAKVPISSVSLPGDYAHVHGIGGVEGWFEIHTGFIPGDASLPVYQVIDDTNVTVEPPAKLSNLTKKRLGAWLKTAYPQRFRPPKMLPNVDLSWAELFGPSSKLEDFRDFKEAFIEEYVNREKSQFGEISAEELKSLRASAEAQFSDTLKTYRKRRRSALKRALEVGPRFQVLMHPIPEYYMCCGRLTAFYRCVISWNEDGGKKVVTPELPFTVDGTVTLP